MTDLLNCPFCGSTYIYTAEEKQEAPNEVMVTIGYTVGCDEMTGCGVSHFAETEDEAVALWNRRAALSPASTGQVPEWIGQLYAYLESTLPEGAAVEAFRVAPEEVRMALDSFANAAGNIAGVDDISAPEAGGAGSTDYETLERERLGDADKHTGIYHPDNRPQSHGGYCADCNSWGGGHQDGCQRRPARFFAAPAQQVEAEIRDKALEEAAAVAERQPIGNSIAACIRKLKSAAGSNNGEKS